MVLETSFSGSYWKSDHLYLNQFMIIQHLPLISFLANLAGDRPLLVLLTLLSDNSTNIDTDRVIFLVIICAFHHL